MFVVSVQEKIKVSSMYIQLHSHKRQGLPLLLADNVPVVGDSVVIDIDTTAIKASIIRLISKIICATYLP